MTGRSPKGLVVFGFGGHARSVADIAIQSGITQLVFVADSARENETLWGFPARKTFEGPLPADWQAFAAAGDNRKRCAQVAMIHARSWPLATLVASSATVSSAATVAAGCFVGHHAHIGPLSVIGAACILNTGSIVDHESKVGECSHISVNSTVAGRCSLGSFVFLGAGATVIDGVNVADSITIGAGSVVNRTLLAAGTYVGVPARPIEA